MFLRCMTSASGNLAKGCIENRCPTGPASTSLVKTIERALHRALFPHAWACATKDHNFLLHVDLRPCSEKRIPFLFAVGKEGCNAFLRDSHGTFNMHVMMHHYACMHIIQLRYCHVLAVLDTCNRFFTRYPHLPCPEKYATISYEWIFYYAEISAPPCYHQCHGSMLRHSPTWTSAAKGHFLKMPLENGHVIVQQEKCIGIHAI